MRYTLSSAIKSAAALDELSTSSSGSVLFDPPSANPLSLGANSYGKAKEQAEEWLVRRFGDD